MYNLISQPMIWKRYYKQILDILRANVKVYVKQVVPEKHGKSILSALDILSGDDVDSIVKQDLDVFDSIIARIVEICGERVLSALKIMLGDKKLFASQVLRLWVLEVCEEVKSEIVGVQSVLMERAVDNVQSVVPSLSDHENSRPLSLGYYFMSYTEGLQRDRERLIQCKGSVSEAVYSGFSGAGTVLDLNFTIAARTLGFKEVSKNSLDNIVSRDYILEFASCINITSLSIQRIMEDMLSWYNPYKRVITFKALKLLAKMEKAKFSIYTISGDLVSLFSNVSRSGSHVTSEIYEIPVPLIALYTKLKQAIVVLREVISSMVLNRRAAKENALLGDSIAPDLRDWVIKEMKMDIGAAEELTRKVIELARAKGTKLSLLSMEELRKLDSRFNEKVYSVLLPSRSIIARRSFGGTNPVKVRKHIRLGKKVYV